LEDQASIADDHEVLANLFELAEQMAGSEDRDPVVGDSLRHLRT
jgi:hypothetical protein